MKDNIRLEKTKESDLMSFFQFQLDSEANHLAAFMPKDSHDKNAYLEKYTKFLSFAY